MKQEIKEKLLAALGENGIKEIIDCEEFYFKKAIDKYNEFMNLPKLGESITNELISKVKGLSLANNFNYMNFLNEFKQDSLEYKVLLCLGELVAHIDFQGANKNQFNKYEDKRTIAKAYVRQNNWTINLLGYKEEEKLENLPGTIRNAVKFILYPHNNLNVLSERHRELIGIVLFGNPSINDNFSEYIINEFSELNITVKNEVNRTIVYERLIYNNEVRQLWEIDRTIWKISHGNGIDKFSEGARERYFEEKLVVVADDTGRGQGKSFKSKMKIGDLFYLCYGNDIKLLGMITSDAAPVDESGDGWLKREYKVIKESINNNRYTGELFGWTPNYNSTCMSVKNNELIVFEKEILKPYFEMELFELFDNIEDIAYEQKFNDEREEKDDISEEDISTQSEDYFKELNYILYGPPGTGKTYNSINYAVAMIEKKDSRVIKTEEYRQVKARYEKYKKNNQIVFTTFHQSYGYEEFIQGLKPFINEINKNIFYDYNDGVFKQVCDNAIKNPKMNYVLIIDEINRGNISKIFGELITLIEKTKRIGAEEEIKIILPYSKKEFGVPANVYILGTMNTADRSIALLDTALRRRFKFIEIMPDSNILYKKNNNSELNIEKIDVRAMLDIINKRIEIMYDREHTIGHAYFMELIEKNNIETLSDIFIHKILPLLQEYFYDDYEKIRMILGDNSVSDEELQFITVTKVPEDLFGKKNDMDFIEDKKVYTINESAFSNPDAYIKIYDLSFGEK